MWHHVARRSIDVAGAKGFSLPTASLHYAPDRQAAIDRVVIELWLPRPNQIRGRVRIALSPLSQTARFELDAAELRILAVNDDRDHPLAFAVEDRRLVVHLAQPAAAGTPLSLSIDYEGAPRRGIYFIAPCAFDPERPSEVWTQGQDDDSRHWFPCFDAPNQKAKTEMIAHVPRGRFALSNGELADRRDEPDESIFHYRQDTPHSTYLVSLVVGEYVALEQQGPVPVISYVHPRDRAKGELTFSRTAEMVRLFSEKIGIPYPYPRYSQICVADFIFGGMENTTATTLTELILFDQRSEADFRSVAENLVAHELAHQWWGDLVTCADWSHAWLNEGFATYFETLWREHAESTADADYGRFVDQQAYLEEKYRRPLVERRYEEPIDLFDRHQYEKGACVLHLIRRELGDDAFFRSLRRYGEKHRGGSVETNDLRRAIEEVTGRNLEALFDQWVHAAGHPELAISGSWDPEQRIFDLTVEQKQKSPVFTFGVEVELATDEAKETHRIQIQDKKQTLHFFCEQRPRYVVFDRGGALLVVLENRLPSDMLRALACESDDVFAVIDAVRALVRRQEPASLAAVFEVLKHSSFWGVRLEAAKALENAPGSSAKEALIEAVVEDGDPRVRRAAIRALRVFKTDAEEIAQTLIRHVESETSDYAIADVVRTVADLRTGTAHELVAGALEMTGHNHCIRAAAVESIARLRDLIGLPTLLSHTGPQHHTRVREAATEALGKLAGFAPEGSLARTETKDALVRLLSDPWLRVRMRAAEALAHLGDRSAASVLESHADKELDGRARRSMRLAARDLKTKATTKEQVEQLSGELEALRRAHAELLERIGRLEKKKKKKKRDA
jgi:aminopeptidase N